MTDVVSDEAALTALYGPVNPNAISKEISQLNAEYRHWIEQAPFMAIASIGAGGLDCSPRGDVKGRLFRIIDDQTIAIPDRRGNNRLDTLKNLVADPRIALLFLLPGINESLRINGEAQVVTDHSLIECFTVDGKAPVTVILVTIKSVYFQCASALLRSALWSPENFIDKSKAPTAGQMIKSTNAEFDAETYDAEHPVRKQKTLY